MASILNINNDSIEKEFSQIQKLVSEQKFITAINELQKMIESDNKNLKANALLEYLEIIIKYHNQDIFSSTNLDMDPWIE
jgi:flagellar biosynthesis regulator FlbT